LNIATALALSKLVGQEFWNQTVTETKISRNDLIECVIFLTNLLQFDFVFIKPCDTLDNIVDRVIRYFEEEEIILIDMVYTNIVFVLLNVVWCVLTFLFRA